MTFILTLVLLITQPATAEDYGLRSALAERSELTHFPDPIPTDNNMSVLINSLAGIDVSEGSELGCLTISGYVAGAIVLEENEDDQWGMSVWGDDPISEEIDGFQPGEQLMFLYWDAEHNWELNLVYNISAGRDEYRSNSFLAIDIMVSTPEIDLTIPLEFGIIELFPNPFNSATTIRFGVPRFSYVNIIIYNSAGAIVDRLFSGNVYPGIYAIRWQAGDQPAGVYYVRLESSQFTGTRKVALIR